MPTPREGYRTKDGAKVPSVTTILGRFKKSGGLIHWAFARGQSGAKDLYDEKAAEVGTAAHAMVEAHIKRGEILDPATAEVFAGLTAEQSNKALAAFDTYLTWARHSRLEVVHTEIRLVSEWFRFGGTPDAIGRIDGKLCLLDWKTSNRTYPEYWMQLAAYVQLWEENEPFDELTGAHLIRFGKELGDFTHGYRPRESLDLEWTAFKKMRELYDLDREMKKRAA